MKSCFFIGHREATEDIFPRLAEEVDRHISEYGVREFVVGNYGGFDRLAARAVIKAKETYPQIVLSMLLPYHPAERPIQLPQGFDGSFYPPGMEKTPRKFAILRANQYMVDHTDYLIAYVWHTASNARELLDYGREREGRGLLKITNLCNWG